MVLTFVLCSDHDYKLTVRLVEGENIPTAVNETKPILPFTWFDSTSNMFKANSKMISCFLGNLLAGKPGCSSRCWITSGSFPPVRRSRGDHFDVQGKALWSAKVAPTHNPSLEQQCACGYHSENLPHLHWWQSEALGYVALACVGSSVSRNSSGMVLPFSQHNRKSFS